MVFDTLYGEAGADLGVSVKTAEWLPAMWLTGDGTTWTLTLRDGLMCSMMGQRYWPAIASRVSGAGVCADLFGQTLMQRTDALTAPDDRTIVFRLNKPVCSCCPMLSASLAATCNAR